MVSAVVLIIGYGLTHPSVCDKDGTVKIFCKASRGGCVVAVVGDRQGGAA